MRKYLYLAMAAASATVIAAPVVAQAAPAVHPHVLTIKKAGGTAVKVGAKLSSSLVKGSTAVFTLGSGTTSITIKCKSASFTAVVVKNPTAPGTATESQTTQSIGKCTDTLGATIKSIKALNLPYNATVSDKTGFPVTVAGRTKTKPITLTANASLSGTNFSCTYTATIIKGNGSNKGSTIKITKQPLNVVKSKSNPLCPAKALFSATFGPVVDTSVTGKPAVFVN